MQSNTTYPLIEQYLSYLVVIKGRAENTIKEYRTDLLMFFRFVLKYSTRWPRFFSNRHRLNKLNIPS